MCKLLWICCCYVFFLAQVLSHPNSQSSEISLRPNVFSRDLPIGTCNADTPCANGACCSKTNICGYSPDFCGTGCQHNCDAKAGCGKYAPAGQQKCPLNVCCSQFGFCGTTSDFCGKGCDATGGACGPPKRPACSGGNSISANTIAYYESWSNTRKCQSVAPEDLNLAGYSQANFAFVYFDPSTYRISPMDDSSAALYSRFTALKQKFPGLKTWASVGGWSFTDPGSTRSAFSDMSSSSATRKTFINGVMNFMNTYGFDGIDLDWEYPAASDRGGLPGDTENYVALVKDMRAAFGSTYGLSVTLPTSYWYLQHFDLAGMQPWVDNFGLMSYDLHGTWDNQSIYVGPYIAPHTNITEIDAGLDLLWYAGVNPNKVVLGLAYYGRSFALKDPACHVPNGVCQFSGGANAGPCSATSGILDDQEIQNIITSTGVVPTWDKTAGVKWITWDSNQWVSYDDEDTFKQKETFANSRCLNGAMVWALDQVDQTASSQFGNNAGVTSSQQSTANQMSADQQAGVTCYTADCGQKCRKGTNAVTQMSGQPGQLSTSARCPKGKYQTLCCDDGTITGICTWRGFRGVGLSCIGGCADGETELVQNTNHHDKKVDQSCTGGLQSYCCAGFKPAPTKAQLEQDAENAAKAAAEAAAANAAIDLAAKAFCRVAVPALLAPLELLEDVIPIFGEIADLAEIAATPAIIEACVKGVEKDGEAEFKVFGKKHTLDPKKPTEKPSETRKPEKTTATHKSSETSKACSQTGNSKPPAYTGCAGRTQVVKDDKDPVCQDTKQVVIGKTSSLPHTVRTVAARGFLARRWHKVITYCRTALDELTYQLHKRAFADAPPDSTTWPDPISSRTVRAWQRWYVGQSVNAVNVAIGPTGEAAGGTTSLFRDLTTNPGSFTLYTGQLEGCTVLSVISRNAVYMAHFWQDKAFDGYPVEHRGPRGSTYTKTNENPTHYITEFLNLGRNPATDPDGPELDGLDKLVGLLPLAAHFRGAADLQIIILTPGAQSQARVAEYGTIIAAMEAQVVGILGFAGSVQRVYYEPPDKDKGTGELNRVTGGVVQYVSAGGTHEINVAMAYQSLSSIRW